ncbi:deoxynucleotidyltransferase terminal-interacting protein 2 isoform X2 [Cephus cinctus]|uniref:Deoxynucleotidyltransferase terminal-interacting protein 2 isoform X2 n=1 Tax=Cephus cinctus TaxID=211228 RepID=A0AAJ7W4A4_CEPCN|nr:deoxynucleotidyltransferase terminal-interacting protein 2 isoform X2 [Cephus cinctus]
MMIPKSKGLVIIYYIKDVYCIYLDPTKIIKDEKKKTIKSKRSSSNDIDLDEFEADMGWRNKKKKQPKFATNVRTITKDLTPIDKVLEKSVIKPGFEQLESVPRYDESEKRLRALRRREREKTKGKKWFNLPATEVTEEIKHDLEVIQMRSVLDPKHFYKKNDIKALPKYFQIGKVIDSPLDYYNGRLTKKERKRTIVDELMADAEFAKYNKRKYKEIIEEKRKMHYKAHRHAKKLKGKKKK